jgi:hypothetical protein
MFLLPITAAHRIPSFSTVHSPLSFSQNLIFSLFETV